MTDVSTAVTSIISIILGGGIVGASASVISARSESKRIKQSDQKLPAEVESLWLGGAEKAVSLLQAALDRAEAQITRLDTSLERAIESSLEKDARLNRSL